MYKYNLLIIVLALFWETSLRGQINKEPLNLNFNFCSARTILYAGIDNNFRINSRLPVEKWEITSSNGTVKMSNIESVVVTPEKAGIDSICFYYMTDSKEKKLIAMYVLNVDKLPIPQIKLGKNNRIELIELKTIKILTTRIPNIQYYLPYVIKQCKILTIKSTGKKTTYNQTGNVLSNEIKSHFQTLQKGDMIIIKDVKVLQEKNDTIEEEAEGVFLTVT
jgi:hypothetical protein